MPPDVEIYLLLPAVHRESGKPCLCNAAQLEAGDEYLPATAAGLEPQLLDPSDPAHGGRG